MGELAGRAEEIAAHLVEHALGATVRKFDSEGRQSVVDFVLEWPDGRRGALEVTLVTETESSAWQGLAAKGRLALAGTFGVGVSPGRA